MSIPNSPHFFVIGAGRSGTTSLHRYLAQHPQLFVPPKNPSFFYAKDISGALMEKNPGAMPPYFITSELEYFQHFANLSSGIVTGDVSPVYLASTRVASRIARSNPSAKLIALLRHPADRVYSRYVARRRDGLESASSFEELLEKELRLPIVCEDAHASYLPGGMTSHFLQTYFDVFPAENIAIYFYEDFAFDAAEVIRSICRFLGVRDDFPFDVSRIYNKGGARIKNRWLGSSWAASEPLRRTLRPYIPKRVCDSAFHRVTAKTERIPMLPKTREKLIGIYREDIKNLQCMTGRDLSPWLI